MNWYGVITNAGKSLLARQNEDNPLIISGATSGTGKVAEAALLAQTALAEERQTISIIQKKIENDSQIITLRITSVNLTEGYVCNQIGLWAKIGEELPILFALYQNDDGQNIPSHDSSPEFVWTFNAAIEVNNEAEINITVDTQALVTQEELEEVATAADNAQSTANAAKTAAANAQSTANNAVKKTGVISAVNQSSETVVIDADRVDVEGVVELINEGLATKIDGSAIQNSSITAEKVNVNSLQEISDKIGGFTVDDSSISYRASDTDDLENEYRVRTVSLTTSGTVNIASVTVNWPWYSPPVLIYDADTNELLNGLTAKDSQTYLVTPSGETSGVYLIAEYVSSENGLVLTASNGGSTLVHTYNLKIMWREDPTNSVYFGTDRISCGEKFAVYANGEFSEKTIENLRDKVGTKVAAGEFTLDTTGNSRVTIDFDFVPVMIKVWVNDATSASSTGRAIGCLAAVLPYSGSGTSFTDPPLTGVGGSMSNNGRTWIAMGYRGSYLYEAIG